jgi:hypothetical protein
MAKKILIGIVVVIVALAAAFLYLNYRNRTLSPPGSVSLTEGDLSLSITYSRPSVRGRLVFGTQEQKALQPYGEYWRLGANEATEITISKDAAFNGEPVKAGTYRIYAIPGPETFDIILNSELGEWGAFEPDPAKDVLKTKVPVEKGRAPVEQYTIRMEPASNGIDVIFEWSDVQFTVPVTNQ